MLQQHWLKTDFNKWRDEDDSDAEGGDDMQLEDMMKQMGNFNTDIGSEPVITADYDSAIINGICHLPCS